MRRKVGVRMLACAVVAGGSCFGLLGFGVSGSSAQGTSATRSGETNAAFEQRLAERQSPEGRARRLATVRRFADQGRAQALETLRAQHRVVAGLMPERGLALDSGERIADNLGPHSARVDLGGERPALAVSSSPLTVEDRAGVVRPIDLRFSMVDGRFEPLRSPVPVRVGESLASGVEFVGRSLSVAPSPVTPGAIAEQLADGKLFYANVARDADALLLARPRGVELMWQLRSVDAPTRLGIRFALPQGASLALPDGPRGAAQVIRDGEVLAAIQSVSAFDADQFVVPSEYAIDGDELVVHVDHRADANAYPIVVDPEVGIHDDTFGTGSWSYAEWGSQFNRCIGSDHLCVWTDGRQPYGTGSAGEHRFRPQGTGFVFRADFNNVHHRPAGSRMTQGIYAPQKGRWEDAYGYDHNNPSSTVTWGNPHEYSGPAAYWYQRYCLVSGCVAPSVDTRQYSGNYPAFKMTIDDVGPLIQGGAADINMWGTSIYIDDPEPPGVAGFSYAAQNLGTGAWEAYDGGWRRPGAAGKDELRVQLAVNDPGVGPYESRVTAAGLLKTVRNPACSQAAPNWWCGNDYTFETKFNLRTELPEGSSAVSTQAFDLVGRAAPYVPSWNVKIDGTAPRLSLDGPLYDRRVGGPLEGEPLTGESYELGVAANDPAPVTGGGKNSGVVEAEVEIRESDGSWRSLASWTTAGGDNAELPRRSYQFRPAEHRPEGLRTMRVVTHDGAGNETTESFVVDTRRAPTLELSGGLRSVPVTDRSLHIKATDLGGGIKSVKVFAYRDGEPVPSTTSFFPDEPCTPACDEVEEKDYVLAADVPEGANMVLVRATDSAGLTAEETWRVDVSRLDRSDPSRLGLEEWFLYDEVDAGGGSSVYLNGDTGNAIWHSTPIVNHGRGLSTIVNLTYNSQDAGGAFGSVLGRGALLTGQDSLSNDDLAALSYGEAGVGFSIGISGPTRVNEPLRGVLVAAAAEEGTPLAGVQVPSSPVGLKIAMTDADGTRHVFTRDADGWQAPPGVNLHLRRYVDGGSPTSPIASKWALTRPDGVTSFFDTFGFLTRMQDRNGNALTYRYEERDAYSGLACAAGAVIGVLVPGAEPRLCMKRLVAVEDAGARELRLEYVRDNVLEFDDDDLDPSVLPAQATPIGGVAGRIRKITDHAGREYEFVYADGYLTSFTEAANRTEMRQTRLSYETIPAGEAALRPDRFLRAVREYRDVDGDGSFETGEEYAQTLLTTETRDASTVVPATARAARRLDSVQTRVGGTRKYTYQPATQTSGAIAYFYKRLENGLNGNPHVYERTWYRLDARGRAYSYTDTLNRVTDLGWSETDNKLTAVTKARGTPEQAVSQFAYDEANGTGVLLERREYPSWPTQTDARTTAYRWDFGPGQMKSTATGVSDASGAFVADIDEQINPRTSTNLDYTVDDRGNITKLTDTTGAFVETVYDPANGNVTEEFDELRRRTGYAYAENDVDGLPRTVTDPRGEPWRYRYDGVGNVTRIIDPRAGDDPAGAKGDPYTTSLSYDAFDRLVEEHVPLRSEGVLRDGEQRFATRTRTFDRNGNLTRSEDATGALTMIDYDKMDLPVSVTRPGSGAAETTSYVYDIADRLIAAIDPRGAGVDLNGIRESHRSVCKGTGTDTPVAFLTRYCLDDEGRLAAEIKYSTRAGDQAQLISSFAYDRRDNRVGLIDPRRNSGRTIVQAIQAAEDGKTDASKWRLASSYNHVDEQTASTERPTEPNRDGSARTPTVWEYGYDANGNRTSVRHPNDPTAKTTLSYDYRDRLIASKDPLGRMTCMTRDAAGQVTSQTSPRGTVSDQAACTDGDPATGYTHFTTRYDYDAAGDLNWRSIPFAPGQYEKTDAALSNVRVTYTRDAVGDPVTIEDTRGRRFENRFFDGGELRSTQRPGFFGLDGDGVVERHGQGTSVAIGSEAPDASVSHGDFGRVQRQANPDGLPAAGETWLAYDAEMRLERITDVDGNVNFICRDAAGRVNRRLWSFRASPTDCDQSRGLDVIAEDYGYDRNGNLTSFTDGEGNETTSVYDGYDRLASETSPGAANSTDPGATGVSRTMEFDHDPNGNQIEKTSAENQRWQSAYDSLDRLESRTDPGGKVSSLTTTRRATGRGACRRAVRRPAAPRTATRPSAATTTPTR